MKIYTREEIYKALRNSINPDYMNDKEVYQYIDHLTAKAYLTNQTHGFKNIMKITYDYYNDPNFPELERLLDSVMETSDNDNFEI